MSERHGGPAFPMTYWDQDSTGRPSPRGRTDGMSLRDYFAGQALMGLTRHEAPDQWEKLGAYPTLAAVCYEMADAMLAERERDR